MTQLNNEIRLNRKTFNYSVTLGWVGILILYGSCYLLERNAQEKKAKENNARYLTYETNKLERIIK
jgi:hypothetical protein